MRGLLQRAQPTVMRCAAMKTLAGNAVESVDYIEQLSKEDFALFMNWILELAALMRLSEFDFKISPQSCEAGYVAEVEADFNYHKVKIALCPHFHTLAPERKRSIMVHELLHVHMSCAKMPYESLIEILSADAYTLTAATALRMEEHVVTSLEYALTDSMPLPPVIGDKPKKQPTKKIKKSK